MPFAAAPVPPPSTANRTLHKQCHACVAVKDFLDISEFDQPELDGLLDHAARLKQARAGQPQGVLDDGAPLAGRVLAMIFEKPSTRTRVSFDMAIRQLGGQSLVLSGDDLQLGRGESVADTARVLSRFVDAIMIRTFEHEKLLELAEYASVPVINGLTDSSHPCQVMADLLTRNNVTTSWIHAAARFGFELRIASPEPLQPHDEVLDWGQRNGAHVEVTEDPQAAADGADCVVTDTWLSMNHTDESNRHNLLKPYQVDENLMAAAKQGAVFMHCLPAHRGEEVASAVIDGPQSVVFDEAENRLHVQKSILTWCLKA
jgi:ornithine carbamoyltransferase